MLLPSLPFDTYRHDASSVSQQRVINAYAEAQPRSARSKVIVKCVQGIALWTTVGTGPIRGKIEMNGVLYVISGQDLWSVAEDGTPTIKGSGIAGSSLVGIAQNGLEIVIVNGVNVFSYLLSADTLVQVGAAGAYAADTVTVLGQTFVLEKKGTNQFFISGLLDGRSYDVLDFASAESNPDYIIGVKAYNGLLYLLGGTTSELWNYTGGSGFPFSPISGQVVNRGIASSRAVAAEDNGVFILGNDRVFYRIGGAKETRISTFALEDIWKKYGTVNDAFCFHVDDGGHKFIYLTFPTENATFGYDISTALWHERWSYDYTATINRWRASGAVIAYGLNIVGDSNSNRLGYLSSEVFTEFGDPLITRLVCPPYYNDGVMLSVKSLHLQLQGGVGLITGQGSDPLCMMRYSHDAVNYSAEDEASMGLMGEYNIMECMWSGLGSSELFVFEFSVMDPVRRIFTGLSVNRPRK